MFFAEGAINGARCASSSIPARAWSPCPLPTRCAWGSTIARAGAGFRRPRAAWCPTYAVRLDSVRLGSIELAGVEAIVIEQGLDIALLGMSFLNRLEMQRDGQTMILLRRF